MLHIEMLKSLGRCDAFVKLRVGPVEHQSQVVQNNKDPIWSSSKGMEGYRGYCKTLKR